MGAEQDYFLGVKHSITGRAWQSYGQASRIVETIIQAHDVPELLARVLAARDVPSEQVAAFLQPTLRELMPQPGQIRDMEKAAKRFAAAIMAGETIAVIGDFDVDGMASTALIWQFLAACSRQPLVHIPDRIKEGYGPNRETIARFSEQGAHVLLTLDCGVMAHGPLQAAHESGLETIVIDHHQAGEELPQAFAVVNPNRHDDLSGLGMLCAAGVTFIFLAATAAELRREGWWGEDRRQPDPLAWLDLVALATVCDVVPLRGLNRAFVRQGLKVMHKRARPGLAALADSAGLTRTADTMALGFALGPRLNAAGRMGSAMLGVRLMITEDISEAREIAAQLEALNRQRQNTELRIIDEAVEQAAGLMGEKGNLPVITVQGADWHPGVLGLVAGRLKEHFNRPAIALGPGRVQGQLAGSARSITGVDVGRLVQQGVADGVLISGGGHAMAAGMALDAQKLPAFRAFLEDQLSGFDPGDASQPLRIDGAVTANGASLNLIESLEQAGPFGQGNPAPVFALPAHRIAFADVVGTDHVRCTLIGSDNRRLNAIAFRCAERPLGEFLLSERQHSVHVAGRLNINEWGGARKPQLIIEDAALPVSSI